MEKAAALVAPQAEAKGLRLMIERSPEALPLVRGDSQRVAQVLLNLLSNAIKFTDTGQITIRFERTDQGAVKVLVEDTGIGIPQDQIAYLFTEFYQADAGLTRKRGGTGLGLVISKRLAILMGGDVSADSRPGEGSTFALILRVSDPSS